MKARMLSYTGQDSPVHRLTGAAKLIIFAAWSVSAMITYDTRCLLLMLLLSLIIFRISRVRFQDYAFVLYFILFFFLLNQLAIFAFSPLEGTRIYGTRHDLLHLAGRYTVTAEQLFYQLNIALKYAVVIPVALLFLLTTDPSEFAASLNRIGVHYKIAYSVSLALRYIPDIQQDYENISFSAQARGIDISRKEKLPRRLKNMVSILLPLVLSSIERIEKISTAMELRSFGTGRRRTWYRTRPFTRSDYFALCIMVGIAAAVMIVTFYDGSRFYSIF
ncbi:energy-coupling factor transporter transmembrane component T [Paenibacillus sp. MMS20-IR301]|uniref:energy-coupling factor transporter transmembrane component T family protein n=1 Tax=Paenibacillus sp. MMS20-IR301 TaxID=2895946 RepID=UPI0028E2EF44|nr:energy-coupling factor transporter transmembrane component T [Paenibacillus sp. MMS20-IR301]WNS43753.1 energy-coupling factor transporter transmembrane component T [Paenibacillus sp. MMS20-IR301]